MKPGKLGEFGTESMVLVKLEDFSEKKTQGILKKLKVLTTKSQVRWSSWSKIRYLLQINGPRSPFVRLSSRIHL